VAVSHEDHGGVAVAPAVPCGGFHQPLDLRLSQVFAGAQIAIGLPFGGDCSVYGGWRDRFEVPYAHALRAPSTSDCSYNNHYFTS